jgi:hypothetical protein
VALGFGENEHDWTMKITNKMQIYRLTFKNRASYEWHLESKERFDIKKYLLTIGKKKDMQVLSHTFSYFST